MHNIRAHYFSVNIPSIDTYTVELKLICRLEIAVHSKKTTRVKRVLKDGYSFNASMKLL